jgi:heme oxygenase
MSTLLPALRQATQKLHSRLEHRMNLFGREHSRPDYERLLRAFWGFYQPLEARLGAVQGLRERVPDLDLRLAKTAWLETDLLALGLATTDLESLPRCSALPDLPDEPSALGCLYVIEGSTLGGQIIGPHFRRTLGMEPSEGGRFFAGYGPETATLWRAFGEFCAGFTVGPEAIRAACGTFETLEAWLEQSGLLREVPPPRK